jgi:hypothetical protein
VVVAGDTIFTHENATASGERAIAVDPNVEGLNGLATPKFDEHVFDYLPTLPGAVEERPKEDLRTLT